MLGEFGKALACCSTEGSRSPLRPRQRISWPWCGAACCAAAAGLLCSLAPPSMPFRHNLRNRTDCVRPDQAREERTSVTIPQIVRAMSYNFLGSASGGSSSSYLLAILRANVPTTLTTIRFVYRMRGTWRLVAVVITCSHESPHGRRIRISTQGKEERQE